MKTIVFADNQPASGLGAFTTGGPVVLNDTPGYYIQAVGTDPATAGTITVEHSTDGLMWTPNATTIAVAGTTPVAQDLTTPSRYLRISYADTGAVGNLIIKMNILELQS